jgi:5,10-methylenetetrahydrofolate reductase
MPLKKKLDSGEFAVLAEIEPPKGVDVEGMISSALAVKGRVDAFLVPEMSNAVMRMSSLGGALLLRGKGLEVIMQANCRDRNRIALQADLLAAYACGIHNVMAVGGEDPSVGDHHEAKAVYDIELPELLEVLQKLQTGKDMSGIELQGSPEFVVGSNINAGLADDELTAEIEKLNARAAAGVRFFVLPPVFDLAAIDPFLQKVDRASTVLIPTVLMLKSVGMARYIQRHLSHVHIPDSLISRLQKAPDKERECVAVAAETAAGLKAQGFSGVLFSMLGWEHRLPEVLRRMRS